MADIQPYQQIDLSGGVQTATSRFLRRKSELASSKNAIFNKKIGSAARRDGYEQVGRTVQSGNDSLGAHIFRPYDSNKVLVGTNDITNTFSTVRFLDTNDYWTSIISDVAPNTRFSFLDFLNECYVAGYSPNTNTYMSMRNIGSDMSVSSSRNVYTAPKSRFITDFQNGIVALNCEINGVKYKDRFYLSSPALGFIVRVQGDQQGLLQQLLVDSVRYLKPGMIVDIYSAGTNSKVVDSLSIVSVDKRRNIVTFTATQITLKDNDELWLEDRKNQLSVLWNTDYPTPEDNPDWKRIPPGVDSNPEITAHGKNNNRLLIFTRNSTWKFDGANMVMISDTVGCIAPETVKNVAGWTLFLHNTGVWGYNDSTGAFKILSRPMDGYIRRSNLNTIERSSAVVVGRIYKLSIGELSIEDASTTSTSTSSTSTSSTSSSTSSTSTSSTSTSSTSTSTTNTTTSTSSTSTSSTSTSSTSSSISTSSTSTSLSTSSTTTTTVASTREVYRLVYDFDSNIWWVETHTRDHRYQLIHTMNGYQKPYFTDETGRFFRDETGNMDHFDQIPFEIELGRNNQGSPLMKNYVACVVQSEKAKGALLMVAIDNSDKWVDVGQIVEDEQVFKMSGITGRDINYRIAYNTGGDGPVVDGITTFFSMEETKIG